MSTLTRPDGAVMDVKLLKMGDVIWPVYGTWPITMGMPRKVHRIVYFFKYLEFGGSQGKLLVFETVARTNGDRRLHFADDGNMVPTEAKTPRNNFWFRTEVAARRAVKSMTLEFIAKPELLAREIARTSDEPDDFMDKALEITARLVELAATGAAH